MTTNSDRIPDEFARNWVISKDDGYGALEPALAKLPSTPWACWYILVVELCERLAFYTFNGTIVFFLERVGFSLVQAGGLNASMVSLCFCWPLVASWLADVICGRYKTILISGIIYAIGCAISGLATWPSHENVSLYFLGVLLLIPLSTAGIKSNLSILGADQFDESDPTQALAQERFFSIFYLSINVGALVAYGFLTTFATNGGLGVPRSHGYMAAYELAACFMALATAIFFAGSDRYRKVPVQNQSALAYVTGTLIKLARNGSMQASAICFGSVLLLCSVVLSVVQAFLANGTASHRLVDAGFVCAMCGLIAVVVPCLKTDWLGDGTLIGSEDALPASYSTTIKISNADLKGFLQVLPPLMLGTLAFNALYNCMAFWFQQQACQMDLRLTPSIQLAGSFFNVADCLAIVLLTPLAVDWLNPMFEAKTNCKLDCGTKFGVGMMFGCVSVVFATLLEIHRRVVTVLDVPSQCAPQGVNMSNIQAVWMVLPYFLMGIGEIYCNPTLMHYAYSKSPASTRTLAAAVSFFLQAVSSSLFALFLERLRVFVPNDLNRGHLEYGYFTSMLAGIFFYILFVRALANSEEPVV